MRGGRKNYALVTGFMIAGAAVSWSARGLQRTFIPDGIPCCAQAISGVARIDSFSGTAVDFTSDQQLDELRAARAKGLQARYRPAFLFVTGPQLMRLRAAGGVARVEGQAERMLQLNGRRWRRYERVLRVVRLDSLQGLERRAPAG